MRLSNLFENDDNDLFGTPTKVMQWKEHVAKVSRAILSQFKEGNIDSIRRMAMDSWNLVDTNGFKRIPALEPILAQYPETAFKYAKYVIKGRWPEAEQYLVKDTDYGIAYAFHMLNGVNGERWPELEEYILDTEDAEGAFLYSRNILRRRWKEAESFIADDGSIAQEYDEMFGTNLYGKGDVNEDLSDEELFGEEEWYAKTIIKMLRSYHTRTMADLDSYNGDVRDELEDEAEQADYIAQLLERGEIKRGIDQLYDLDSQTRGTMTEFMKSYNVDMKKVYRQVLGLNEDMSDEELFGDKTPLTYVTLTRALTEVLDFFESNISGTGVHDDELTAKLLDYYDDIRASFGTRDIEKIRKAMKTALDDDEISESYLEVVEHVLDVIGHEHAGFFGLLAENTEPSDDELFGQDQYDPRKIGLVILKLGKYYQKYEEDEDILEDAQHLIDISKVFFTQGLRAGIRALRVLTQDQVWDNLSHDLFNILGLDLNALCDRYDPDNLEEDLDDDELFGAPTFEKIDNYMEWVRKCGGNPDSLFPLSGLNAAFKSDEVAYLGYADISESTPKIVGIFYTFRDTKNTEKSFGTKVNGKRFRIFQDYAKADPYNPLKGELSEETEPSDLELFGPNEDDHTDIVVQVMNAYANYLIAYVRSEDKPDERHKNILQFAKEIKEVANLFETNVWSLALRELKHLNARWEVDIRQQLRNFGLVNAYKILK